MQDLQSSAPARAPATLKQGTAGAGFGGALGFLLVWLGPQWGWFDAPGGEMAAALTAALGTVCTGLVGFLLSYLPAPRGAVRSSAVAALLALVLALGGCAGSGTGELKEVVASDVRNAKLMAERTGDQLAVNCWTFLAQKAVGDAALVGRDPGQVSGVLSAYQLARNARKKVTGVAIDDDFRVACGPMLIESAGVISRLGIRVASPFN